ncbi:FG-GAP repeat domain-containing protein [Actinacidiphila paucisporea]|uniref:FG-GAP repeat domain-containing protein n=1 Tax=Actinacidiphila paucisporea TaxID=310782 RepID=UPI001356388E|nr:VCBS repeat-containing protein [Actinacidiphila paucisporea]
MSETHPVQPKGRRRLVAACTAGILSLGAFALGTGAQAAEPGAHRGIQRPTVTTGQLPHLVGQKATGRTKSRLAPSPAAAPPRYDVDGDGIGDLLYRTPDDNWYSDDSQASQDAELGAGSEKFVDVLTPGDLDASAGPEILATTSTGSLELFSPANFPNYASWTGTGWNVYNKLVSVDDVTGDGRADIIARTFSGQLYLYQGTGNPSAPFAARLLIGPGWGAYDQLTSPGDIDGDGVSDLVARDSSGVLYRYKGTGSAARPFGARSTVGSGWNAYNQLIGVGASNGSRGVLLARTAGGALYQYTPNGTGGFTARALFGSGWNIADVTAGTGGVPFWGKKELIGETPNGSLFWYGVNNTGGFYARQAASGPGDWAGEFTMTFANALTSSGLPTFLDHYGNGLYNVDQEYALISNGWSSYNLIAGPGDLSGDGKGDLLGRDTSGNLYLFRGYGDGLRLAGRQLVGAGWGAYNAVVGSGDFSGDGRADIVARTGDGTLYLYKGTGNASAPFAPRVKIGTGWGQYTQLVSPGDMDGDGRADLLAVTSAGTAYRYSSTGTGQFKARATVGTGWNAYKKLF